MMNTLVHNIQAKLDKWGYGGRPLIESIALYQQNHAGKLQELARAIHHRVASFDGDVGPGTAMLMNTRICDNADTMPNATIAEANWPETCRNDITVSWNFNTMPGLSQNETDEMWQGVKEEYERLFEIGINLNKPGYAQTRIFAAMQRLSGSTLAWSYLAQDNCNARLEQAYDSSTTWSPHLALGTCAHEVGHALGMNHTPSDYNSLMYPSMNGQTGLNNTDINQMLSLGYKQREEPTEPGWGMFG